MGDYKCRECREYFDEPHEYVEYHGFSHGPGERWAVCPHCGSCDWAEAIYVEAEEEFEASLKEDYDD